MRNFRPKLMYFLAYPMHFPPKNHSSKFGLYTLSGEKMWPGFLSWNRSLKMLNGLSCKMAVSFSLSKQGGRMESNINPFTAVFRFSAERETHSHFATASPWKSQCLDHDPGKRFPSIFTLPKARWGERHVRKYSKLSTRLQTLSWNGQKRNASSKCCYHIATMILWDLSQYDLLVFFAAKLPWPDVLKFPTCCSKSNKASGTDDQVFPFHFVP